MADGHERGRRPLGIDAVAERHRAHRPGPVTSSVMIWRRSAGSNAPNVRRSRATTLSNASPVSDANHVSTIASSSPSWTSTVPDPARNPSTNAAPVGGRGAAR